MIKTYSALWIISILAALITLVTGHFHSLAMVVFGFLWFGLSFMGLMGVLPTWVGRDPRQAHHRRKLRPSGGAHDDHHWVP